MPRISSISAEKARALAEYIGKRYGNGNDVLTRAEVQRALASGASDAELTSRLCDAFGGVPPEGSQAVWEALFGRGAVRVGSRPGGPGEIWLKEDGSFRIGEGRGTTDPVRGAMVLYEAALLVNEGVNPYAGASPAQRQRALAYLEQVAAIAADRSIHEMTPSARTMAMKSGSATALLALAEAANGADDAAIRSKAIDTYLSIAEKEIHRGLRVSMTLNLDSLKGGLGLSEAQRTRLSALLGAALPSRPPYEEWFKEGNQTIQIKQYVHSDYWDVYSTPYTERGFTKTELPNGKILWEKTMRDPAGQHPDTRFRIEVSKVADYSTDRKMLQDMNDPDTQIEIYTGHSNLGGNVAAALKTAPRTEVGTKLTYLWVCRGKQNVADFTNRFPKSHLITTHVAPDGLSLVPMLGALVDTVASRGDYASMAQRGDPKRYHLFPFDRGLYDHRDLDSDGKPDGDGAGRPDRVFDIYPRAARGKRVDYVPGPSVDPARLDGTPAANALGFANTLFTYHVQYGDRRSPITAQIGDHLVSEGFFQSGTDEFLRITPREVDGKMLYGVAINSRYANQSEEALGVRALYELNRWATSQARGGAPLTLDDKVRGMLLAAEYIAYMTGPGEYADELISNLARVYRWPSSFGYDTLAAAIDEDVHGYVSSGAVASLRRRIGPQLGDGSAIV